MNRIIFGSILLLQISNCLCQNSSIFGVNLFLVAGTNLSNSINISWSDVQQLLTPNLLSLGGKTYDASKNSVIYAYGWQENLTSPSVQSIVDAYSKRQDQQNIFILDWSQYAKLGYIQAVWNVPKVADFVTEKFLKMKLIGFNFDNFHMVGFSLGAQLCGYIGRYFQTKANYTFPRITGLDSALVSIYPEFLPFTLKTINKNDARFVDLIHTSSMKASSPVATGHVDFFPNGGVNQPGCSLFSVPCSHRRSWQLYSESLSYKKDDKKFQGLKCNDYYSYALVRCRGTPAYNYLGYYANPNMTGKFFLKTNATPLFSL